MHKEIGSEFWSVPVGSGNNNFFPPNTEWFLSGRSALSAIVSELKDCKTVEMPSWCCDSMIYPFISAGLTVNFYPVYFDGELIQKPNYDCDILFAMDYFGYSSKTLNLNGYNGKIICDLTQSAFSQSKYNADYYFGSLRKWCAFATGGYAYKNDGSPFNTEKNEDFEYINLRKQAFKLKEVYINGCEIGDKEYLKLFEEAENRLENAGICFADKSDIRLAEKLDIGYIKSKRQENAKILMNAFSDYLIFNKFEKNDAPMFVPILVSNGKRDYLRQKLIENKIYCPVHWGLSQYHNIDKKSEEIYNNELSLVCDQRYNADDMNYIAETIMKYI